MKSSIVVAAFAFCLLVLADHSRAQSTSPEHSMTGCLARGDADATFKLTDLQKGPKVVLIAETTANLAPHVGHKVEITGVPVPGKDGVHTMKVTAVKMISATCP